MHLRTFLFFKRTTSAGQILHLCALTDPNTCGKVMGLIRLLWKREDIPIIHQEALLANLKNMDLKKVMQLLVEIINFILARTLNYRQFWELIQECETKYRDLFMHNEVSWLCCSRLPERFLSLLTLIHEFFSRIWERAELDWTVIKWDPQNWTCRRYTVFKFTLTFQKHWNVFLINIFNNCFIRHVPHSNVTQACLCQFIKVLLMIEICQYDLM